MRVDGASSQHGRIKNFRALPLLRVAFTRQIEGMKKSAA